MNADPGPPQVDDVVDYLAIAESKIDEGFPCSQFDVGKIIQPEVVGYLYINAQTYHIGDYKGQK